MLNRIKEFCIHSPFFLAMVLFALSAFFFELVNEIDSVIWLISTLLLTPFCLLQKKISGYIFIAVLFLFGWYRLSIAKNIDDQFRFPEEWHQKIIEVNGVVHSIDALDQKQEFEDKRKVSFVLEIEDQNFLQSHFLKVFVQEYSEKNVLPGDKVRIVGRYFLPRNKTVPNSFDMERYYRENSMIGQLQLKSWGSCEVHNKSFSWRRYIYLGRSAIYQELNRKLSPDCAALMSSVVLGYTSDLKTEVKTEFQQWGIAHIFSVSGLHLGLVGFWVWLLSGFFIISLRKRTVLTIGITFLYCLASGMSIATVRALLMLVCFLASYLVKKRTSMWNNFSFAFVILFLIDPRCVFTASFQLSFMAVAGILITQEVLSRVKEKVGVEVVTPISFQQKWRGKIFESFYYPMMISAATIGITAWHFQVVSFVSVVLNIIVVPVFSILMGVSFFYFSLLFLLPSFLFWPLEKISQLFMALPGTLTGGQGFCYFIKTPNIYLILFLFIIYCALVLVKMSIRNTCLMYFLYFLFAQALLLWQGQNISDRLVLLDVGKASACMVQNTKNETLLFDCGTVTGYDLVSPFLKGEGINKIDDIFISHDNFDHFSCWPKILKNFTVNNIWKNSAHEGDSAEIQMLENEANANNISLKNAYAVEEMKSNLKNFSILILHPKKEFVADKNNESLVLLLRTSWSEVLFTGDAQDIYESLSTEKLPEKKLPRILIFPHHGRNIRHAQKLLDWFQPDLILISGDTITADVKSVLENQNVPWYVTSKYGTIEVQPSLELRHYQKGKWHNLQKP